MSRTVLLLGACVWVAGCGAADNALVNDSSCTGPSCGDSGVPIFAKLLDCPEDEQVCHNDTGREFDAVCYCPRRWTCEADGDEMLCEQVKQVPGAGDWSCDWSEEQYLCTRPGSESEEPTGMTDWSCGWSDALDQWSCTKDYPPNPRNTPVGTTWWECAVDEELDRLVCRQSSAATEVCDDGADNDLDGKTDCEDSECECTEDVCDDDKDNDYDGKTDYDDPDCGCLGHPCCDSKKIAFVSCEDDLEVKEGTFDIDVFSCAQLLDDTSVLNDYDTIAYMGPYSSYVTHYNELIEYFEDRLTGGAKIIVFGHPKATQILGMTPHYHENEVSSATIEVTEKNDMSEAFDQDKVDGMKLVQMNSYQRYWCGDLFFKESFFNGHFHGYVKDTAKRKGVLLFVGLSYYETLLIDFSEPFLAAQLMQTWDASEGTSDACGMGCDRALEQGVGKPVIYLYPEQTQRVTVELDFDGELVTTYPQVDPSISGWEVVAEPNGSLTNVADGQPYSYIFWNGITSSLNPDFTEGFVVKGEDTRTFLQQVLSQMGLLPVEYNELILYWTPYMENHAYNLINFAKDEYFDIARMTITPEPDSLLRVFMVFKELQAPISIPPQPIEPFDRQGFTVVEWGGSEIGGDWHIVH